MSAEEGRHGDCHLRHQRGDSRLCAHCTVSQSVLLLCMSGLSLLQRSLQAVTGGDFLYAFSQMTLKALQLIHGLLASVHMKINN